MSLPGAIINIRGGVGVVEGEHKSTQTIQKCEAGRMKTQPATVALWVRMIVITLMSRMI